MALPPQRNKFSMTKTLIKIDTLLIAQEDIFTWWERAIVFEIYWIIFTSHFPFHLHCFQIFCSLLFKDFQRTIILFNKDV